jgi:hypothetical protein
MRRHLHHYATLLALCAVLLRSVIPLGWMPSADAGALALCTADGLVQLSTADAADLLGQPPAAPDDGHVQPAPCSFAAAGSPRRRARGRCAVAAGPVRRLLGATPYSAPFLPDRPAGNTLARARRPRSPEPPLDADRRGARAPRHPLRFQETHR